MNQSHTDIPVIILAGGFGTRLRHVVSDVPKPMAPIGDRPFLEILLDYVIDQGMQQVILATGYQADIIRGHFGDAYRSLAIAYSHEETALGTGGAIQQVFERFELEQAFVLNGDTYFGVSLRNLHYFHEQWQSDLTISLKYLQDFDRYGTVSWNAKNKLHQFNEKMPCAEGWINGGIYLINKAVFGKAIPVPFSFETEIMEKGVGTENYFGLPDAAYFIDIGVADDYYRFQREVHSLPTSSDKQTFFLDRDGVINKRIVGDYVRNFDQFEFLPNVIEAMKRLDAIAARIIIVTNQQGIGKGLMKSQDVLALHDDMLDMLSDEGIAVQGVYFAPGLAQDNPDTRKPNVGMALAAKRYFPSIDWANCVMVGDSTSDIEFGLRMGMHTVLVADKSDTKLADEKFDSLPAYIATLSLGAISY